MPLSLKIFAVFFALTSALPAVLAAHVSAIGSDAGTFKPDICKLPCLPPPPQCDPAECSAPANGHGLCRGSACSWACNAGYKVCGSACIPISACCTANDCPAINNGSATCVNNVCGAACPTGTFICGSTCYNTTCVNPCYVQGTTVCDGPNKFHCSSSDIKEVCNGLDDNCDGQVDEGGVCRQTGCQQ